MRTGPSNLPVPCSVRRVPLPGFHPCLGLSPVFEPAWIGTDDSWTDVGTNGMIFGADSSPNRHSAPILSPRLGWRPGADGRKRQRIMHGALPAF